MAGPYTPVGELPGIGEKRRKALEKLGIRTLLDLISHFPRRYEDRTGRTEIASAPDDLTVCIEALIGTSPTTTRIRGGLTLTKFKIADSSGVLDVVFFNQPWLSSQLKQGETYVFCGKIHTGNRYRQMASPIIEAPGKNEVTGRIVPIYPAAAGVSQLMLSRCMRVGLDACEPILPDALPDEVRMAHGLCRIGYAYEQIHFPDSAETLDIARRRLAFEELFFFSAGIRRLRAGRDAISVAPARKIDLAPFYAALPFTLTGAQQRAIADGASDMTSGRVMNRLVQGDVGSGKTMVAAALAYFMAKNGRQSALMAPTEILARQHFATLEPLLAPLGLHVGVLTGATKAKDRRELLFAMKAGTIDLVIGTHALLTGDVEWRDLGLVITDEQHRFGVAQRSALAEKGLRPHLLVMSATPIPRTLALILYGDLDVSIIDELPPGRKAIQTFAVGSDYRERLYAFIRKLVTEGRQVYIVCPMVEENDELPDEKKAVTKYAGELQKNVFPDLRVDFVHGRMKPKEKDAVMQRFAAGETDILVSTTVIEVGVDVPNAALMLIENAERFGLSQLHQLRGRVGRGQHQSYCVLVSDNQNEETRARLAVMCKTANGFAIAEEDLRLRGPGDFFGERQHGLPGLRVADIGFDTRLAQEAQKAAEDYVKEDPDFKHCPAAAERLKKLFEVSATTLN